MGERKEEFITKLPFVLIFLLQNSFEMCEKCEREKEVVEFVAKTTFVYFLYYFLHQIPLKCVKNAREEGICCKNYNSRARAVSESAMGDLLEIGPLQTATKSSNNKTNVLKIQIIVEPSQI